MQRLLCAPAAGRLFVEVGLGSSNWSFTWASSLGYRCIAIEPLPVETLRKACNREGVLLVEAAMSDKCGMAQIYHGKLNEFTLPDISSLNPKWWGVGETSTEVRLLNLSSLLDELASTGLVSLKVDVEGCESSVLLGLNDLKPYQLPDLVCFEYGGGGERSSRTGAWNAEGQENTLNSLNILKENEYKSLLVCESTCSVPYLYSLGDGSPELDAIFLPKAEVGMVIASRSPVPTQLDIWIGEFKILDKRRRRKQLLKDFLLYLSRQLRRYQGAIMRRIKFS